jgi:predicted alpha/beta-fold hydrolase
MPAPAETFDVTALPNGLIRYAVPCNPPAWARGGHAQTLSAHLWPHPGPRIHALAGAERFEVEMADGDRLVAYALAPHGTPSGVRVHLMHGLSGDIDAEYMRSAALRMLAAGHQLWCVNHRGCGAGAGLARQPYHSGKTEDLQAVLAASCADAPALIHVVVGFSLSGNLALLHAAQGLEPRPHCIVAVNPPVDLERTSIAIGRGLNRLYELRFMHRLRAAIRRRDRGGPSRTSRRIPLTASLLEFDDLFTAPECGFESGRDYYRRCSSLRHLHSIETPTVILTSADDPFVDPAVYRDQPLSEAVFLHVEASGGHVGYLARQGFGCVRWLPGALAHYVDQLAVCRRSEMD